MQFFILKNWMGGFLCYLNKIQRYLFSFENLFAKLIDLKSIFNINFGIMIRDVSLIDI